jgi:hypothetical protein
MSASPARRSGSRPMPPRSAVRSVLVERRQRVGSGRAVRRRTACQRRLPAGPERPRTQRQQSAASGGHRTPGSPAPDPTPTRETPRAAASPSRRTRQRFTTAVHYQQRDDTACRAHARSRAQRRDRAPSSRDSGYCRGRLAPISPTPPLLPQFTTDSTDCRAIHAVHNDTMHDSTHPTPDRRRYRP